MELIVNDEALLRRPCAAATRREGSEIGRRLLAWVMKNNRKAKKRGPGGPVEAVGLAAPQVGILKRVCVTSVRGVPSVFVNPRIVSRGGFRVSRPEECLSFPGRVVECWRWSWVEVACDNVPGTRFYGPRPGTHAEAVSVASGWDLFESVAVQHEVAHVFSRLIFDFAGRDGDSDDLAWANAG